MEFAKGGMILVVLYELLVMFSPTTRSQLVLTGFKNMPNVFLSTDLLLDDLLSVSDVDVMAAVIGGSLSRNKQLTPILK